MVGPTKHSKTEHKPESQTQAPTHDELMQPIPKTEIGKYFAGKRETREHGGGPAGRKRQQPPGVFDVQAK